MSIVTTYKCDRCGAEQDTPKQMWEVAILTQHLESLNPKLSNQRHFRFLPRGTPIWCRKCIDAVGLLDGWTPPTETPASPEPTLEDKVREIMRDEIQAAATLGRA